MRLREYVCTPMKSSPADLVALGFAAVDGLVVVHREGEAHRHSRRGGPDGVHGLAVGVDEHLVGLAAQGAVLLARWEHAEQVADGGDDVGFVDGAGPAHDVGQVPGGPLAEVGEASGGGRSRPATLVGQPARRREVVEGHHRLDARLPQRFALAEVVVEGGHGVLAVFGLDPAPLDGEPVVGEAQLGQQGHVLAPAVPAVAGVPARLLATRAGGVLPAPPVVVPVPTFDLVGGGGRAPAEAIGEALRFVSHVGTVPAGPR
jgi:hypothetical protein